MSISNNKRESFIPSVSKVSSATALSRVLGLVREQVMAYYFGAGMATDAFVTAFRIPNILRDMFAEGALSQSFIPIFKKKLVSDTEKEAFNLASIIITFIFIVVGLIVILGVLAAPAIIYITANGFTADPEKFSLTVSLTRIMFFYLLTVSLAALVMGILNSFNRFGIPALSSSMFNLGMILSVICLYNYLEVPIYAMAIGVIIGGLGQVFIQVPSLRKIGYKFKPVFNFLHEDFKKVMKLFMPMIIGLSASRVNILISTLLASFLVEGSISYLSYSYRLMHFPMGVFAVALGTVALPKISELVSNNDTESLSRSFAEAFNLNIFILIPSGIFLALFGKEIVQLIFQWGEFSYLATDNTYLALLHYSYGLIGFGTVRVVVPFYYAFNDSKLPMKFSLITVLVNIILYYPLIQVLNFAGLAAATSLAGLLNCILLIYFLPRKGIDISFSKLWLYIFKIIIAASIAFYSAKMIPSFVSFENVILNRVANLIIPGIEALLIYILICFLLRIRELNKYLNYFKK